MSNEIKAARDRFLHYLAVIYSGETAELPTCTCLLDQLMAACCNGDDEANVSIEPAMIAAAVAELTAPTFETFTVAAADWIEDNAIAPFAAKAAVTAVHTIGENTRVSLKMDAIAQATGGIVIGDITGQAVTLYAIVAPAAAVDVTLIMEG